MNLLTLEDEKFKTVEVMGYSFKIRAMSPKDRVAITQRRMRLQNGNPVECLQMGDFVFFENIAIVDVCTEELPSGFNKNESCISWSSIDLINELATEIKNHTELLETELKKNRPVA